MNNPLLAERCGGGLLVLEGSHDILVELRLLGNRWTLKDWLVVLWNLKFVVQLGLGNLKGLSVRSDFVVNAEVWHKVVSLWRISWLALSELAPVDTHVISGLLTELEGGFNILILTEVRNSVASLEWNFTLILVVVKGASVRRGGAVWIFSDLD